VEPGNKKIVVVDDESDILVLVHVILSRQGYEVLSSKTVSAVDEMESFEPDLILLDINLEGSRGDELCKMLKSNERTKKIPVILMSGVRNIDEISLGCGAEGFLSKPFPTRELVDIVGKHLSH
jgi:DNA-binding response OmpR family regulator